MASNDSFTETTTQGWLSRIKGALVGVILGPLLIIGSVWLLSWNEGRAIRTATALNEGKKSVIAVSADSISEANNGKLVYVTGTATTEETLEDSEFEVAENVLMLRRRSEMYQWKEKENSSTSKNLGGSETTTTTYSYSKEWSDRLIDSSSFKKPGEHTNPEEFSYPSDTWVAQNATLGAFQLSEELVRKIGAEEKLPIQAAESDEEEEAEADMKIVNGEYYLGEDPKNPRIGDIRISYYITPITKASIVAAQTGNALTPFTAQNGTTIALVQAGIHSSDSLFADAQQENSIITWLVRMGGILFTIIGFVLIMKPLSVIGDVIPIVGSIIGFGTGLLSFILGLSVATLTIAIAWIAYRPILAGCLIVGVGGLVFYLYRRKAALPAKTS